MKTKQTPLSYFFIALVALLVTHCSPGKKEDSTSNSQNDTTAQTEAATEPEKSMQPQFKVDDKFQQQLSSLFSSYVSLKDAFVSSDASQVKIQASSTFQALGKVDMNVLTGAAHHDWMTYLSTMQTALKDMEVTNDIEAQRKAFSTLSDALYKSIKAFGLNGKEAFYEFCPMAFHNEGGYWLSDQKQIRNPYFGDKMLTCGEVKETLN